MARSSKVGWALALILFSATAFGEENGIRWENDFFAPGNKDRWRSNSVRVEAHNWTFGHEMYTPSDKDNPGVPFGDRPWDGYIYIGKRLSEEISLNERRIFEFRVGQVGEGSYADKLQRFVHNDLGFGSDPKGWETQNPSEETIDVLYTHESELLLTNLALSGLLHSRYGVRAGNVISEFFLDQELERGLIQESYTLTAYLGVGGRVVLYNTFLDGRLLQENIYTRSDRTWFVSDIRAGLEASYQGFGLRYEYKYLTEEFDAQDGRHLFGAISFFFDF